MHKAGRKHSRAFTLIEVLMVIVILGLLATLAIVQLRGTREGAKIDTTKLLIQQVANELEKYNLHIGHYPTDDEGGMKALVEKPTFQDEKAGEKWRGPYLKEEPKDAWGNLLKYEVVTATGGTTDATALPYKLSSNGPDGQEGTDDDITLAPKDSTSGSGK